MSVPLGLGPPSLWWGTSLLGLSPSQPQSLTATFSLRPSLLLPNRLALMETLEDAPDPFFGIMSVDPRLPSPFDIPQVVFIPLGHLRLMS